MKRRNTRPGRRLEARRMGGAGSLPVPASPDVGVPRYSEVESGLIAPSHGDRRHGPVLFSPNVAVDNSRRYRTGRPDSSKMIDAAHEAIVSMSACETLGMRLMIN